MAIGDGNILRNAASPFGAAISLDIENSKIFEDIVFSIAKRFTIGISATVDIVIDPQACNCGFLVFLPVAIKAFQAGPVNIDFYFGVDSDEDGTLWESANRLNTSSTSSNLTVRLNPTINDVGIKLPPEFAIYSNGTPAIATIGGESVDDLVFVARQDGKYMFRLINQEAAVAQAHASFNWFEVPTL